MTCDQRLSCKTSLYDDNDFQITRFREQLDRVCLHPVSTRLLDGCCCQLSGCWLILPACLYWTWLYINILNPGVENCKDRHMRKHSHCLTPIHALIRPFVVSWWMKASVDFANLHTLMRIRTMEWPNPDNPISVSPDCCTDQPDPVCEKH